MADSSDRVAELKRKMQEAAAKRQAEQAAAEQAAVESIAPAAPTPESEAAPESVAAASPAATGSAAESAPAAVAEAVETTPAAEAPGEPADTGVQPLAEAIEEAEVPATADEVATSAAATPAAATLPAVAAPSTNGATAHVEGDEEELSPEEREKREMTRRELLTYAWAGALALVAGATGYGLFEFMYPRFRAGEFGGEFFIASSEIPPADAGPVGFSSGKFWLVQSETDGPRALYMVCTHLGCLYKWEASNFRFECPCHGSKFSKDGYYIEGPAPRSLDTFATTLDGDTLIVDTGSKTVGAPATESPDRAVAV